MRVRTGQRLADHQVTTLIRWTDGHSPGNPTWSPDRLGTLYVMHADGHNPTPLTDGLTVVSQVAWSPDGTRIAFSGGCTEGRLAGGFGDLFVIAAGGGARTPLAAPRGGGPNEIGGWSPDGRQFVYEQTYPHRSDVTVINVDGSGYGILPINGHRPVWAPR